VDMDKIKMGLLRLLLVLAKGKVGSGETVIVGMRKVVVWVLVVVVIWLGFCLIGTVVVEYGGGCVRESVRTLLDGLWISAGEGLCTRLGTSGVRYCPHFPMRRYTLDSGLSSGTFSNRDYRS